MADQQTQLRRIVALKRQKAEQSLSIIQSAIRKLEGELEALQGLLAAADGAGQDFQTLSLASQHGHVQRLLSEMEQKQVQITLTVRQLDTAKESLKQILNSEDELAKMSKAAR